MSNRKNTDIAERPRNVALERPSFIKEGDVRGAENIGADDIRPPALRIAQSGNPETKRQESAYIEGLREGDLFNSVTKEIYGEDPVGLVIVHMLGHRHVEFAPMSEGGGVIDFSVPDGDPRTQFTTQVVDGVEKRIKPKATKFYDFLVLVITGEGETERRELMTLSFKSTQLKKAVRLNTLLSGSKVPSFAHLFEAQPVPERRQAFNFYGWKIEPKGWVSEELFNEASAIYEKMKGKTVVVETEGADTGDSDEGGDEPRSVGRGRTQGAGGEKIPF